MGDFTYNGIRVVTTRHADIPSQFRPNGALGWTVQSILDDVKPWQADDNPIETRHFNNERVYPMAVETTGYEIVWGIHRGHRAREPKLSPFIESDWFPKGDTTGYVTIELMGTADAPILTRAYGGRYTPPLPWMTSSKEADGGREFCREYWKTHAYLDRRGTLMNSASRTTEAPAWFTES